MQLIKTINENIYFLYFALIVATICIIWIITVSFILLKIEKKISKLSIVKMSFCFVLLSLLTSSWFNTLNLLITKICKW